MSHFRKEDDGSQAWFDQQLRTRHQQRQNQRNINPLDRRIQPPTDPAQKETEIHDPYIRELIAKRNQQPHYEPVPLSKEVNVDMDGIMRQQQMLQQTSGMNPLGDADLDKIFNHRQQSQPMMPQQPQQATQQVMLREGYPVFRPIQQAFGNTFVLAREVGIVNSNLASQPFIMRNVVNAYVVPQHQTQVNIQEIQNNPHLLSQYVEVHAPPMASLGPLLVHREAIVSVNQYAGGRNVLTDAHQPYNNGRRILKG